MSVELLSSSPNLEIRIRPPSELPPRCPSRALAPTYGGDLPPIEPPSDDGDWYSNNQPDRDYSRHLFNFLLGTYLIKAGLELPQHLGNDNIVYLGLIMSVMTGVLYPASEFVSQLLRDLKNEQE